MTLAQYYMFDEMILWSVTGELVLNLWLESIEKVFHLPTSKSFYDISYESVEKWYRKNKEDVDEIVKIMQTPPNRKPRKVDLTCGYMIPNIGCFIMLLSRHMGLGATDHLETWMIYFIEKIYTLANMIDLGMIISNTLHD